jgi:hypothetical protein
MSRPKHLEGKFYLPHHAVLKNGSETTKLTNPQTEKPLTTLCTTAFYLILKSKRAYGSSIRSQRQICGMYTILLVLFLLYLKELSVLNIWIVPSIKLKDRQF